MLVALIITLCRFAMFDKPTTNIISFSPHSIYTGLLWRKLSHFFVPPPLYLCVVFGHTLMVVPGVMYFGGVSGSLNEGGSSTCQIPLVSMLSAAMHVKTGWQLQRELKKRAVLAFPFQNSFFTLFPCSPVEWLFPLKISPHLPSLSVIWRTNSLIPAQICWSLNKRSAQATTSTWTKHTIKKKENTSRYVLRNIVLREYTSLF